jgi:hypothetical protein
MKKLLLASVFAIASFGVVMERWCPTQQVLGVFLRRILVKKLLLIGTMLTVVSTSVFADERDPNLRREYSRQNPPPPGCNPCILDHINPLRNGGTNDFPNLQWQPKPDAILKDRTECDGHKCGR